MLDFRTEIHRSCYSKGRYPSFRMAQESAERRMREGSEPLWIYDCEFCHGYHLTKNRPSPPRTSHKPLITYRLATALHCAGYVFRDAVRGADVHVLGVPDVHNFGPEHCLFGLRKHPWWTCHHERKYTEMFRMEEGKR